MSSMYVYCPKCGKLIPRRNLCRGVKTKEHAGLFYQKCTECKWFTWTDPPDEEPYGTIPMGDPFPDIDRSSPPPQDDLPLDPELDPELYDDDSTPPATPPTPAQPTVTPVSSTAPSASVSAASSHPPCSNSPQCKRLATAKGCSHRMCKTCCQLRATGCAYAPHRNSTPIVAANGNPSALARPPAIIPSASASSAASLPIDEFPDTLAPKTFRKSMNEA
ncbi:hypothetical protein R3P38DRAFT_469317 [Favolaschia claudopus]|uniref:Uncharacterized protein n=1 Tax=Favolaschia claudopus TaxID=2862362 RepID=A0AAV9ZFH0_9AGAR